MYCERAKFLKTAGIYKFLYALAGRELAGRVLFFDTIQAAARLNMRASVV
jgi:hypothetical protein